MKYPYPNIPVGEILTFTYVYWWYPHIIVHVFTGENVTCLLVKLSYVSNMFTGEILICFHIFTGELLIFVSKLCFFFHMFTGDIIIFHMFAPCFSHVFPGEIPRQFTADIFSNRASVKSSGRRPMDSAAFSLRRVRHSSRVLGRWVMW